MRQPSAAAIEFVKRFVSLCPNTTDRHDDPADEILLWDGEEPGNAVMLSDYTLPGMGAEYYERVVAFLASELEAWKEQG